MNSLLKLNKTDQHQPSQMPRVDCGYSFGSRLQIALLTGLLCFSGASAVLAQEQPRSPNSNIVLRTITVTGRGVESIPATITEVRLGVEVQAKTAAAAQQEAARRSSAVVALLKSRKVTKLQTTGITLNPVYSFNNNVQNLTGYTATNTVSFRLPSESSGNLLDAAVKAGATRIDNVSFVAEDNAISTAQQQALREATQDAQQQANAVLSTLKLTPNEVVSIQVNNATPPEPPVIAFRTTNQVTADAASTPVVSGELQVEASVTLQIRY